MSAGAVSFFQPITAPLDAAQSPRVNSRFFFRSIFVPFVFTRLLLVAVALLAIDRVPAARAPGWDQPTTSNLLNMWSHFDGRWYLSIARDGYHWVPNQQNGVAFSPLYPMLMRCCGWLWGGSDQALLIAGLVISNLSLLLAIGYTSALLLREGYDETAASRASWAVLIFPTSFFLSAVYPMSLFMALAAAAFYYARKQQWNMAGLLAGLAALSRPDAILLTAALGVEYILQYGFDFRRRQFFPLLIGPLQTLGWMAIQWRQFGSPLAFVDAQKAWNSCPISAVIHSSHAGLQLGVPALILLLTVLAVFQFRPSYSAFLILMFGLMLAACRYWSITRFVLVLFPAFMMLGILGRRWKSVHRVYTFICAPMSVILMMRFALNLWVA